METLTKSFVVSEKDLACAVGSGSLRVLATPAVCAWMEHVAAQLAQSLADAESTTVGTKISVDHLSPTPCGAAVQVTATLKSREGRAFCFSVSASDPAGQIASGEHARVLVQAQRFQQKADQKL